MSAVVLVSVVRNYEMYRKCILDNPYTKGCEIVTFDNNVENLSITRRYNSYLESISPDDDKWIVLCHEDWMPLCDVSKIFDKYDRNCIYGPIGVKLEAKRKYDFIFMKGRVFQTKKDGSKCITLTGKELEGLVDTFDCQCIAFHSSLLRERKLRFDENLQFDMYVEDFCIQAFERFGIKSYTINLPCQHYSYGDCNGTFRSALKYIRQKYESSPRRYATIVGHKNTFGGDQSRTVMSVHRFTPSRLIYILSR